MRVAIASGKGGTGKTLVATNLAWTLAQRGRAAAYLDADVEEPNGHLFLRPSHVRETGHEVEVPVLRDGTCSGCGECQEFCNLNAILALKDSVLVFNELCNSCGGCVLACPEDALEMEGREIGVLREGRSGALAFMDGLMNVGEPRATPLIDAIVASSSPGMIHVVDAPPGTSCPAMAAVRGSDIVLLVTEPTPFGLHDLDLAVRMCRALGVPVAAMINRSDLGDDRVREYLDDQTIPILGSVPFDTEIATVCARGGLAAKEIERFREIMNSVTDEVLERLGENRQ